MPSSPPEMAIRALPPKTSKIHVYRDETPQRDTQKSRDSNSELVTQLAEILKERESLLIRLQELNSKEVDLINQLAKGTHVHQG